MFRIMIQDYFEYIPVTTVCDLIHQLGMKFPYLQWNINLYFFYKWKTDKNYDVHLYSTSHAVKPISLLDKIKTSMSPIHSHRRSG